MKKRNSSVWNIKYFVLGFDVESLDFSEEVGSENSSNEILLAKCSWKRFHISQSRVFGWKAEALEKYCQIVLLPEVTLFAFPLAVIENAFSCHSCQRSELPTN